MMTFILIVQIITIVIQIKTLFMLDGVRGETEVLFNSMSRRPVWLTTDAINRLNNKQ